MDLVVNSPMKAGARRERCERLFEYFQSWKIRRLQAQVARQEPPKFDPPKPTVADGLLTLIKVLNTTLATEQFQKSMSKCFEDVGLAPVCLTHEQATYRVYEAHKRGSLNKSLWNPQLTVPEGACLADAVEASCEMEIMTRLDAQDATWTTQTQTYARATRTTPTMRTTESHPCTRVWYTRVYVCTVWYRTEGTGSGSS